MVQQKRIRLGTMRLRVRSLALLSGLGSGVAMSCGIGQRRGSDLAWRRLAAVAPIGPLAWEHAMGAALKRQKDKKKKKKEGNGKVSVHSRVWSQGWRKMSTWGGSSMGFQSPSGVKRLAYQCRRVPGAGC